MPSSKVGSMSDVNESEDLATDEQLLNVYGKTPDSEKSFLHLAKNKVKDACSCSSSKAKKVVTSVLPVLQWLPKYKIKDSLVGDIAGGITVGIVHLPQGMAYSILASLPPITGLYVSFFPPLVYALLGTTRHLSIGTFAVVSLMIGAVIDKHVPPDYCGQYTSPVGGSLTTSSGSLLNTTTGPTYTSGPTTAGVDCEAEYERRKIEVAVGISLTVSLIHLLMYVLRLGIVTIYLSSHMVSGFTCGAAVHVLTSQVPKLLGLNIPRKSGILSVIYTYIDVFTEIASINWATVITSFCCIIVLVIGKEINLRIKHKIPFSIPWELGVVIFSTLASQFAYLETNYNVSVVGELPQGIKTSVPSFIDVGLVAADSIPIAIVIFSVSISLSRMFSEKHAYDVDANQELLAYSVANMLGSFFQCFPSASSLSRSLIWEETGGTTQLTGIVSSALILIILLWIGPLFRTLPEAALAAVIVVNLKRLLLQITQLKPLWKVSKLDSIAWFVTWLAVVLLGVDLGLYVGVGFSLFTVVLRTQIVAGNVMVSLGKTGIYRSSRRFVGDQHNETLVFKFPSPLIYANQERFKNQLNSVLGFKPAFEIARRKKLEKKAEKLEKAKNELKLKERNVEGATSPSVNQAFERGNLDHINDSPISTKESSQNILNPIEKEIPNGTSHVADCSEEGRSKEATPQHVEPPHNVVLDMSACTIIDNDGVKTLKALCTSLSTLNIQFMLANCTTDVRRCLLAGDFPSKMSDDVDAHPIFFVSVEKAVAYVQRDAMHSQVDASSEATEESTVCRTRL